MRGRKKRTLILGILCCLLVFMGVGFAVARTTLNIGGTSTAINTWDVRITNILFKSSSDGVTTNGDLNKVLDDGTTAEINVDFIKPGDYITFEFSVENNGSIDASIGTLDIALSSDNETDSELFDISNTFPENSKLEAGDSVNFEVSIKYKDDADKIPEGAVTFDVKFNYSQGDGNGGNIPGGNTPGGGTEPDKDWDFEVDEYGTIVAYNYDLGTDVVVPAANHEGKTIKTITEQSFIPQGNIDLYLDETAMKFYGIIREDNTIIVDTVNNRTAAEVVLDKTLYLLSYEECQGDSSCIAQYKSISYICKDKDTCYNYTDAAKTIVSISETAERMEISIYINPDPNVSPEESMVELERNIKTLDLSKATNLTTISDSAFYDNGLTDVEFGDNSNILTIGDSAFSSNQISGELIIPDSVTTIGNMAFSNNQISELYFPKTVTSLEYGAFSNNPLETLTIEECNTTICSGYSYSSNSYFGNKIKTLEIKSGEIGSYGFYSDSSSTTKIESLTLGDAVTVIGDSAFRNNAIADLILPKNLIIIGNSAFSYNQISGELIIPDGVTTIGSFAFDSNQISGELIIPDSVTTIGREAFSSNQISGELVIPDSVTSIAERVFDQNQISSLTLPSNLTVIGSHAFYSNQISNLNLPNSLTSIGEAAFQLNQINGELVIPDSVTTIGERAFHNNQISGELTIPNSVTTIGDSAFARNQISSLTLPSNLTTIGSSVFSNNQISGELIIPNSVTTIGSSAFESNQISSLTIGSSVTTIEDDAFEYQRGSNYNSTLKSILIKRTESDFLANVTVGDSWYDTTLNPTITYDPS